MKLLYLLFFCASLLMLFINLNHPRLLVKKIVIGFWIMFFMIIVAHFILSFDFLLPAKIIRMNLMAMGLILFAHYAAEQQKQSARKSKLLGEEAKLLRIKIVTVVFQRAVYMMIFLFFLVNIMGG